MSINRKLTVESKTKENLSQSLLQKVTTFKEIISNCQRRMGCRFSSWTSQRMESNQHQSRDDKSHGKTTPDSAFLINSLRISPNHGAYYESKCLVLVFFVSTKSSDFFSSIFELTLLVFQRVTNRFPLMWCHLCHVTNVNNNKEEICFKYFLFHGR